MQSPRLLALCLSLLTPACVASTPGATATGTATTSPAADPCGAKIKSRGPSLACCASFGIDACGAGLFCAAFDGRTQATCYALRSRADSAECSADEQCQSGGCHPEAHKCRATYGSACSQDLSCATMPDGGTAACSGTPKPKCEKVYTEANVGDACATDTDCKSAKCSTAHECLGKMFDKCTANDQCASGTCSKSQYCQ